MPTDYLPLVLAQKAALERKWRDEAERHCASARTVLAFVQACDAYAARAGIDRQDLSLSLGGAAGDIDAWALGLPVTAVDLDNAFDMLGWLESEAA